MSPRPVLRLALPSVAFCASLALLAGPRLARADDPPPADKPPDKPPEKKDHDDASIFKDWGIVKNRGAAHAKERADFWEGKAPGGKDLFFLGLIQNRAEEQAKASKSLELYLGWEPPDPKAAETFEKNKETAFQVIISANTKLRNWPKVVEVCERYRKDIPGGKITGDTWDDQGRAHRLAGDLDKARQAFKNAADLKKANGILDLADLSLCDGKVDDARAVIDKYLGEEIPDQIKVQYLTPYKGFLDAVGKPTPSLEKAVSVGKESAPGDWKGLAAVFFNWTLQTSNSDGRLQRLYVLGLEWKGKANFAGLMTYVKYNPDTKRVEEDLKPEKEAEWMQTFIAQSNLKLPPCIVVPNDVHAGLMQKFEGQLTVIDGEGKIRYIRINDTTKYDLDCVDLALKNIVK